MRFKLLLTATLAVSSLLSSVATSSAKVVARINLSSQTMNVYVNGGLRHSWAISSGKSGYSTPRGSYSPKRMTRMHYSRKYNNAPMPHSIFFRGGYAIHGTGHTGALGRPASHGCVRLAPGNARTLYNLVSSHGARNTRISIGGYSPKVASYRKRAKTRTVYRKTRKRRASVKRRRTVKSNYVVTKKRAVRKKWTYTFGIDG